MALNEITNRPRISIPEFTKPTMSPSDSGDQFRVGCRSGTLIASNDELHLDATPLEADRDIEFEVAFVMCPISLVVVDDLDHCRAQKLDLRHFP